MASSCSLLDAEVPTAPEAVAHLHRELTVGEIDDLVHGRVVAPARGDVTEHPCGPPVGRLLGECHGGGGDADITDRRVVARVLLEEAGVHLAGSERRVGEDGHELVPVGDRAVQPGS